MDVLLRECRAAGSALVFVSHDERLAARFDRAAGAAPRSIAPLADARGRSMKALARASPRRSAWNRRATLSLVVLSIALVDAAAARRRTHAQRRARELLAVGERHRSDRRRAHRLRAADAVRGVPHRRRHQQHPHGRACEAIAQHPPWLGSCRSRSAIRTAAFRCWRRRPSISNVSSTATASRCAFAQGRAFSGTLDGLYEAVVGAEVADALGYRLGQRIMLSHGSGAVPARNMPTSRSRWSACSRARARPSIARCTSACRRWRRSISTGPRRAHAGRCTSPPNEARKFDLEPKQVTAALVGLKSRAAVFAVQRASTTTRAKR